MATILIFNAIFFVIYILSWLLSWAGFPWPIHLAGIIFYFLPGYNLALAFEQISGRPLGRARMALWSFLVSVILFPPMVYFLALGEDKLGDETGMIFISIFLWLLTIAVFLAAYLWKKQPATVLRIPSFSRYRSFWIAIAALLGAFAVHFLIYPFIPEHDGYNYLVAIEKTASSGQFSGFDNRFSFFSLVITLGYLSQIGFYWLFKIVLPLLALAVMIPFFSLSKNIFRDRRLETIACLSLFFFPVFFLETLVARPQLLFLISFPLIIYLLLDATRRDGREKYPIYIFLFLLVIAGNLIHQAFFFIFPIIILAAAFDLKKEILRKPVISLSVFAVLAALIVSATFAMGLQYLAKSYFIMIREYLTHFSWEWWFLDDYTDTFGQKVGWPGHTFIFYYGYNLGLFLPALIALLLAKRVRPSFDWRRFFPVMAAFAMFFFLAEFLPRLGLPYLPSRMWIFAVIPVAFFIPMLMKGLEEKFSRNLFFSLMVVLAFFSIAISWYLTFNKQGWVSRPEHQAALFIRENTPPESLVISQGGNEPMIDYFAQRKLVYPDARFFTRDISPTDMLFLNHLREINETEIKDQYGVIIPAHNLIEMLYNGTYGLEPASCGSDRTPVYVVYCENKFKGLHGGREWWKEMNFSDANLSKFENRPDIFEKIYDQDGIVIWKYLK